MATATSKECELIEGLAHATAPIGESQKCLLLIEDSEEAMFLVRYALQEHGKGTYRLEWADGLSSGLERLNKGGVDLVLLDLGLPESSGPASYSWVREAAQDIPILVLTGDDREETEFAIAASGVEDFLIKDEVSGSLLMQAIRKAIRSNRREAKSLRVGQSSPDTEPELTGLRKFRPAETVSPN
jgi:DNA-binding response OmpR family regulator